MNNAASSVELCERSDSFIVYQYPGNDVDDVEGEREIDLRRWHQGLLCFENWLDSFTIATGRSPTPRLPSEYILASASISDILPAVSYLLLGDVSSFQI